MTVLPQDVNNSLLDLLGKLSSADNATRSTAEKSLEENWSNLQAVEVLLVFLAEQASKGDSDTIKSFASVLFRRIAIKAPKDLTKVTDRNIGVISDQARLQIRQILIEGFGSHQSNQVRHKLSDAISEVAKEYTQPGNTWDELLPTLFQAAQNQDSSLRESAFRVFAAAPELIGKQYLNQVLPVFNAGFEDKDDDVRIAACTAFVAFFRGLPKSTWQSLSPLLPNLLNSLPIFLENGQELSLTLVLEALIELVELAPKMFKDMFPTIIEFCSNVTKNKEMEGSTRCAALEILTVFAEVSPAMCKSLPAYTNSVVLITLSMLTEVCIDDDDAAEWNNSTDNDDDEEEIEYDTARQALDRIALKLGGHSLASPLFQFLPAMIASNQWRERQAALMALSSAAEGCVDVLITEIPKILDMVLPLLNDDHPRVQYACCNALGQMSTDFADVIQRTAGARILPGLISKLTNRSVPRVQAHAAAALVNFSEAATKEVLEPYLDDLLTNLLGLLNSQKKYVQEQVLTTIAIIADAAEQKFIKYYDTLMPLLTNVLRSDIGQENRLLQAKCIECSTLIAVAVGKEKFSPHSHDLIQLFGHMQGTIEDDDDPVKSYLEQGWGRICRVIGKDFLPYLPEVLPPLIETAKATQDISLLDEEEAEKYTNSEEWDVINLSGRHIAVHTAILDEKVTAMDLLRTYAIELKGDFFPWVQQIVQEIGIPALDFYLHDGVRGSAALTLASLLQCCVYATGTTSMETTHVWAQIIDKLCTTSVSEPVHELLVAYYTAMKECVGTIGPNALSESQIGLFATTVNTNLVEIFDRIKQKEDDDDDEYTEDVDENEDEYTDDEILDKINVTVASVFKSCREKFLPGFQTLFPTISSFLRDDNVSIKSCGLSVVCDLLENTGASSAAYKDMFLGIVGESITSSDATTRQYAALAIGSAAEHGGKEYTEFCVASLEPMFKMVSIPDARANENLYATESMISAIAKICHSYGSTIPSLDAVIQQWLTLLPIIQNEQAAPYAYNFVGELVKSQHPAVKSNITKIVDSILSALSHGTLIGANAQTNAEVARQLLSTMAQPDAVSLLQRHNNSDIIKKYFS